MQDGPDKILELLWSINSNEKETKAGALHLHSGFHHSKDESHCAG